MTLASLIACAPALPPDLEPIPSTCTSELCTEQPTREKPLELALAGDSVFVSLQGSPERPGHHVAVVDRQSLELTDKIEVGSSPTGLAVEPGGARLWVMNRFSAAVSVIDVRRRRVIAELPADYYMTEGVFTPDGALWMTNRWRDAVVRWEISGGRDPEVMDETVIPVGHNPRDIAVSPDGSTLAVAAVTGLSVSLIDADTRAERARVNLGAPPNGFAFAEGWLVVATTSASTHHFANQGPDGDKDGEPGDGTPNINFQDLQNEIAVIDPRTGEIVFRATSDTICCKDFRDVDPEDTARGGALLPPEDRWIVAGALPNQVTAQGETLWVTFAASDEVQRFAIDPDTGALSGGPVWRTAGHEPHGVVADGERLFVTHRLSETLGVYRDGELEKVVEVGDLSQGDFPATDAEIGELFNSVTAPFTVDGDQSCVHCHREGGNIDKAFSMPLLLRPGMSSRQTMAYRGAADSRPWFFESAMSENNFKAVINEFARPENFCCSDYLLFPEGAPADCAENPPPECEELNAGSLDGVTPSREADFSHPRPTAYPSRDAFYEAMALEVMGRSESFGDAVYYEDPITGARSPIPLGFDAITRSLGVFLLNNHLLLPNPNPSTSASENGRRIFESPQAGCANCHPAPTFTASTDNNPAGVPITMPPVVSPKRDEGWINLDLLAAGFLTTFPDSLQDTCEAVCGSSACEADPAVCDAERDLYLGAPTLRGLWDRAPSMLHDGRAQGPREVICTPGHAALAPGETGFNERDGIPDSHGGTSHLDAQELEDLLAYLETL